MLWNFFGATWDRRRSNWRAASRFPPPWSVEETNACFIVRDADGQALAYVYFEEEPGPPLGGRTARPRRGAADRGQRRQAAGAAA